MERILVYQDKASIELWKEKRDIQNQDIVELGKMLKEDNIDLDEKIFRQFVKEGSEFIWSLLEKELEANAKKAGITSRIGKKNLMKGINERSEKYKPVHEKIHKSFVECQNKPEEITISQGKSILTKPEVEKKRQALSIYIETEVQLEMWKILESACKFLNDLEGFVSKKQKLRSVFVSGSPDNLSDYVLWEKDPKVQITETEATLGAGMPLTGGMIYKPNPEAIETFPK